MLELRLYEQLAQAYQVNGDDTAACSCWLKLAARSQAIAKTNPAVANCYLAEAMVETGDIKRSIQACKAVKSYRTYYPLRNKLENLWLMFHAWL